MDYFSSKTVISSYSHIDFNLISAAPVDYYAMKPITWFSSNYLSSNHIIRVIFDRGSRDQVKIDMGVATYNGLAGKVIHTEKHISQVLLLLDQGCSVGAIVQRSR